MKFILKKEIQKASESDPLRALLMITANATIKETNEKVNKEHKPLFHSNGWSIAFHTEKGIVGLWSCWLENSFTLCYPLAQEKITDDIILKHFNLSLGQSVDFENGPRQWAEYYSERKTMGRVWFDHKDFNSYGRHFCYVENSELKEIYYGHRESWTLATYPFDFCYNKFIDCPTNTPEYIQAYRDPFIQFVLDNWKVSKITVEFNNVLVPQQLEKLNYEVKWLKGSPKTQRGWGDELVQGIKGDEIVFIKSANSLVPWITIRHFPYKNQSIEEILTF